MKVDTKQTGIDPENAPLWIKVAGYGIFVTIIVILQVSVMFCDGVAVSLLWRWFAMPYGLPPVGIVTGAGASLTAALLNNQIVTWPDPDPDRDAFAHLWRQVAVGFIRPAVALLIGWILMRWLS